MRTSSMTTDSASDLRARLGNLGTSTLSDALDKLGLGGAVPGLIPFRDEFRVCGPAFTGLYEPVDAAGGTVGDYIDDVEPGAVIVLDNQGRTDCTVWGDILTYVAHTSGIAGTVIDGVCRDVGRSVELRYPVFTRGRSMRTGKDRVRFAGRGVPVRLGALDVHPGDWLVGDADGVVVLAAATADQVADVALEIDRSEDAIRAAVASGRPLAEARQHAGYHQLQTRVRS
jgi:4-hydroxy-4-methyl-2-oxoglutarate aldolase